MVGSAGLKKYVSVMPTSTTQFFFVSGRRRHTRCGRDWSSDVCSSDLEGAMTAPDLSMAQISRRMLSARAEQFTESVIREMTRLALKHGAVNLSQGFPDFAAPEEIKEAARKAISDDINQYAITWGAKPLRDAIVEKFERTQGVKYDPEREITICCGSTEAMMAAMMAIINPGDEIVVFEPFYENYGPDAILSGASPG